MLFSLRRLQVSVRLHKSRFYMAAVNTHLLSQGCTKMTGHDEKHVN